MLTFTKIEQAGRSMVEMLGVLAIIGVLSVGGISGYSKAMAKFKLTKAQDQMSMLLINIRTAYATASSYSGLETETAYQYNILPQDMVQTSKKFVNAFGGDVVVKAQDGNVARFQIEFKGLGRETCTSLASSDWGTEGLYSIQVSSGSSGSSSDGGDEDVSSGGGNVHTPGGTTLTTELPISLGQAAAECASKDTNNSILWTYY